MGVRYVNGATGNNANDGASRASAWATVAFAETQIGMGDTVKVWPDEYDEIVVLAQSGAAGFPITIKRDELADDALGEVVIDGIGNAYTFYAAGQGYRNFESITIKNHGGNPALDFVWGFLITSDLAAPAGQGTYELHFLRCRFTEINRNARPNCLGVPVHYLSYGDETMGGTATRNITFDFCTFDDCEIEAVSGILSTGFVGLSGNVKDWAIRDCYFSNANVPPLMFGSGVVDSGGNIIGAKPDRPRAGVFLRNECVDVFGVVFYNQACHDLLVAQNVTIRCDYGVGCNTEPQVSADYDILRRCWIRDNLFIESRYLDFDAGAWIVGYDDVSDVVFDHNTSYHSVDGAPFYPILLLGGNQATPGKFGIIGESYMRSCIVASPGVLMQSTLPAGSTMALDQNLWLSDSATPFEWLSGPPVGFPYAVDQDQKSRFQPFATRVWNDPTLLTKEGFHQRTDSWAVGHGSDGQPSWYVPGSFGAYDPMVQYDVFGILRNTADVGAAIVGASSVTATLPVPTSNSNGAWVDVSGLAAAKTIVAGGNMDGTINIEISNDAIPTTGAAVATFPGGGTKNVELAARWMRARVSSYKRGAAAVTVGAPGSGIDFAELVATASAGTGDVVDARAMAPFKTVTVTGPFRGVVSVDASLDGIAWAQMMLFTAPGVQSQAFQATYLRVSRAGVPLIAPGLPLVNVGAISAIIERPPP